jgi:hypothetical protein
MTRTETSVGKKLKEKGRGRPPNAPARQLRPRGRQLIRMHAKEAARINSDLAQRIEQLNSFLIAGLPATAEPIYRGFVCLPLRYLRSICPFCSPVELAIVPPRD